jgi:fucose 4-O-acetylase-like acetyltransferase
MRDYRIDNIKAFLIFCVVLGHLCELFDIGGLYRVIYTFHIPVFIFVSGFFAKFNGKKIVRNLICPYIIFQILYLIFDMFITGSSFEAGKIQFTRPYWLMWYLFAMILYHLLIPFIESQGNLIVAVIISCALSLLAGFDNRIGYFLSFGRFLTYLPYFVLGMAFRKLSLEKSLCKKRLKFISAAIAIAVSILIGRYIYIGRNVLYGALSYSTVGYTISLKAALLFLGINWCFFFMWIMPKRQIPVISIIGQNTLPVYLLHGFIKLYLEKQCNIFVYSKTVNMMLAVLISSLIVALFGNKYFGNGFKVLFGTGK